VVFGILGGLIGGVLLGCTRLFSSRLKRLVGLYGGALLLMYFLEYWSLLSGGRRRSGAAVHACIAWHPTPCCCVRASQAGSSS
jgi:hypothetical protein